MSGNLGQNHLVNWDREKLERFEKAYADTKGFDEHYVFTFEGHEYVKSYARHLINYLDGELNVKKRVGK